MMATYVLHELGCWAETVPGFIYANLLGIKNASGYEIDIRSITFSPVMGFDGAGVDQRPQTLERITALSSGDVLSPIKMKTDEASLPSQVLARTHGVVTTAGVLRQFGVLFGQRVVGGTPIHSGRLPGGRFGGVAQSFMKTEDQRVVLREGEGFVWQQLRAPTPRTQEGVFVVRDQSSGATYVWRVPNTPVAEQDNMFALFNGSGSGVVLELVHADICDVGMQGYATGAPWSTEMIQTMPGFRVVKGLDLIGGDTVTPFKRDTADADVPSGITCYRGGYVAMDENTRSQIYFEWVGNADSGNHLLNEEQYGLVRGLPRDPQEGWGPESSTFPHRMEGAVREVIRHRSAQTFPGVVLRRGEVLSIAHWYRIQNSNGLSYSTPSYTESPNTGAKYNIEVEFNIAVGQGDLLAYGPSTVAASIIS